MSGKRLLNTCGRNQDEEEKHMPQSEQLEVLVLGSGTGVGTADCRRRETLGWRLLSEYRLYAQQE